MFYTIKLTDKDVIDLLMALGDASAHNSHYIAISDRILVQLGGENYSYGRPRADVVQELRKDGIEICE